jgi:hypothetical protein
LNVQSTARRATNFAGSKIEWRQPSLKAELQEVIRNGMDAWSNKVKELLQQTVKISPYGRNDK